MPLYKNKQNANLFEGWVKTFMNQIEADNFDIKQKKNSKKLEIFFANASDWNDVYNNCTVNFKVDKEKNIKEKNTIIKLGFFEFILRVQDLIMSENGVEYQKL